MYKLPDAWVGIPAERGSYSRGVIHTDPVSGLSIHGEDFNGVYCCGEVDGDLYVVCHEPEAGILRKAAERPMGPGWGSNQILTRRNGGVRHQFADDIGGCSANYR